MSRFDVRVSKYVQLAVESHADADGAAIFLAIWVANHAARGASSYVPPALIEAYRQVRAASDAEAAAS